MIFARPWKLTRLRGIHFLSRIPFFEAYKNYLQIDINAESADDFRKWKGWVESRLRTLTLKIERHTYNMLQCHPHPGGFTDKSKPFHCCYFMGLQRKKEVPVGEGEQFDIRMTVEEFKQTVNMYTLWKPGMEIRVSHVKRRNIPAFVFPGGVRPSRPTRSYAEISRSLETKTSLHAPAGLSPEGKSGSDKQDDGRKRKRESEDTIPGLGVPRCATSLPSSSGGGHAGSPVSTATSAVKMDHTDRNVLGEIGKCAVDAEMSHTVKGGEANGFLQQSPPPGTSSVPAATSNSKEAEKLAIEKIMSGPYGGHQAVPELDELEDELENSGQPKAPGSDVMQPEPPSTKSSVVVAMTGMPISQPFFHTNGNLEELEPAELAMPAPAPINPAPVQKKPLIRLSFTSLGKAASNGS